MHVLRAELHGLHAAQTLTDFRDRREWRNEDDVDALFVADLEQKGFEETFRLVDRHVHLPVRSDDFAAHKSVG
jgi:hypothetical protein